MLNVTMPSYAVLYITLYTVTHCSLYTVPVINISLVVLRGPTGWIVEIEDELGKHGILKPQKFTILSAQCVHQENTNTRQTYPTNYRELVSVCVNGKHGSAIHLFEFVRGDLTKLSVTTIQLPTVSWKLFNTSFGEH